MLFLCAHSPAWLHPKCSDRELIRLLLYLRGIPRFGEEVGEGLEPELGAGKIGALDTELKLLP